MKRISFLLIAVCAMAVSQAQNSTDGLRYATDNINGTARFNALSGAFGALGGDMSAISINPAGSAVFLDNSGNVSFAITDVDNTARYFNNSQTSGENELSLNQAGIVFVFDSPNDSNWKKFTIGLTYNNTENFDNDIFASGRGNTSIASFFTEQAQGIPLDLLQLRFDEGISDLYNFLGETEGVAAQNAFLGYQGFIFDPLTNDPRNTEYISNVSNGNFNQEYTYLTQGYSGKYTINFGTQYGENWFFGINLNSHAIDYDQSTFLFETNSNPGSSVNQIGFENNLSVLGAGFSAQIGAIAKFEDFRFGLTIDTPTWYEISEETSQYLETQRTVDNQVFTEIVDPRVINVFENYNLRTPGKLTASSAYIFGKKGLISIDYSFKDYSNIEFRPTSDTFFANQNNVIENQLTGASTLRIGGEYRINQLSLRGGFMYEQSPYVNELTVGDTNGFSLGLGYNFGNYSFDVSYARAEQERQQQLYNIGLTDAATINAVTSNVVLTFGVNL
ncbi:transporter [Rasiella rasia]|uniref:Transporter n=1 Tax=Rasiella rasia TaxID=2744027 RepID=A0A6G6GKS1_9FLAO|nr:transporter [Rasiella rasia]QIE59148.1 transporter [Rasiella rasia]